ncbi:MAG: aspartate/glutamate racemase family protein [Phascolarctobacterium sp.]|uniref:aspartate/glutamate racemase family protein n=1 Tax=Phascolarctobacterium sp. TaxID=2049039 RepID=UPI0026DDB6C5|nr:aspartate/glutamate racemase family protein [Phascolarctobacterium sp.]MDO4922137.1 aspartate/glutamate racemase family protein [Phascolarctobacterium sp.]
MKIFIINPDYGMTDEQLAQRCRLLSPYVGPDVELHMECLTQNKIEIDSALDAALAAPEIITLAARAQREGYDAVVIYCFSDPAVDACRELLHIPVVGGGQAACLLAPLVGRQAGLLLADVWRAPEKKLFVEQCGVAPGRIAAIGGVAGRGLDAWRDREKTLALLVDAGRKLLDESGAQVLILGCLSFLGLAKPLGERLGVPVIDAAAAAVSLAESLARQGLHTSRRAYPEPPARPRSWSGGAL